MWIKQYYYHVFNLQLFITKLQLGIPFTIVIFPYDSNVDLKLRVNRFCNANESIDE